MLEGNHDDRVGNRSAGGNGEQNWRSIAESRGAAWYLYARKDKHQDIAEAVSKDIFGVRIDCAQCHDHPLAEEIKQKHYWGLVAFFNRSKNVDTPQGPRISESAIGGFSDFANLQGSSSPNELRFLDDRYIEETRPAKDVKEEDRDELYVAVDGTIPKVPKFSRREQLVEKVLADHPLLAKAMVNRMWGWMMGRGLVHPVDSLDSFHPASHPELLDWLSRDFAASGYDVRRLTKSLASTRTYQLESANPSNLDPKWFATALSKPLTAEMLQRSMLLVLDPVDASRWNAIENRVAFANLFPDVLTEESIANVAQGLLLTNGDAIADLVSVKHSRFLQSVKAATDNDAALSQLFLQILGRKPDAEEVAYCTHYISTRKDDRDRALESLAGAASVASFQSLFSVPAFAESAKARGKRCILLWLCGAPSQFETWDPKPGRPFGGLFGSIPTSIPGLHLSELMPRTATIMDQLTLN